MKKTLSSIAIAFTLIFSTGVVSSSPVLAAPATTTTKNLTKFYQSLPSDPGDFNREQIQEAKNKLNIGSMDILILFVSGIIAAGLLKMADSLASTFGGDSGFGQISSNVSQSMTMMGMTGLSKAYGATKTVAGLGVAGAAAGWKKIKNKGNKFDAGGGGDESQARTPNEFNGEGEKPNGENENPTAPQQENTQQTNDKPTSQGDDHRDDADKNAYDNEEKKEETTEKTETTETAEKTPAGEETAIPVAPKNETESTGTPNTTPDNPTPDNPTPAPAPASTPTTPPASKSVELPKHEG